MLFSNKEVAAYIEENFEPVWESVREVPRITLDFGDGLVLERTLNGNIATTICDSKGRVLDVLPGLYEPRRYQAQLAEAHKLHRHLRQKGVSVWNRYHRLQAQELGAGRQAMPLVEVPASATDLAKGRIEGAVKYVLVNGEPTSGNPTGVVATAQRKLHSTLEKAIDTDTSINESKRREQIHTFLARQNFLPQPGDMTRWLYREVLGADLDDPYLGLGKVLTENYPFPDSMEWVSVFAPSDLHATSRAR